MISKGIDKNIKQHTGAATFVITVILLIAATLSVIFAGYYSITQQKITNNSYNAQQAYEAAEAGLEYGISYLQQQDSTVLAAASNGYISYTVTNNSVYPSPSTQGYVVTFTNVIPSNYHLLLLTSRGTSSDGSAARVVQQEVQYHSISTPVSTLSDVSSAPFNINEGTNLYNPSTAYNMIAGGGVTSMGMGSGAYSYVGTNSDGSTNTTTVSSTGADYPNSPTFGSDVQLNYAPISGFSSTQYFASLFGSSSTNQLSQIANNYGASSTLINTGIAYTCSRNAPYYYNGCDDYTTALSGASGTSIALNPGTGTAYLTGGTLGSDSSPVLLVVNGNLIIETNNAAFNFTGLIYATGFVLVNASNYAASVNGAISAGSQIMTSSMSYGNGGVYSSNLVNVTYDTTALANLQVQSGSYYYAKVPGTWRDF